MTQLVQTGPLCPLRDSASVRSTENSVLVAVVVAVVGAHAREVSGVGVCLGRVCWGGGPCARLADFSRRLRFTYYLLFKSFATRLLSSRYSLLVYLTLYENRPGWTNRFYFPAKIVKRVSECPYFSCVYPIHAPSGTHSTPHNPHLPRIPFTYYSYTPKGFFYPRFQAGLLTYSHPLF